MKAAKEPPTAEMRGEAAVLVDYLVLEAQDVGTKTPELAALESRVLANAIAEYLRLFPRSRNSGQTYSKIPIDGEWHFTCLFCRASINSISTESRKTPPAAFYQKIHAHSDLCAARFLAGQIEAIGPKGERCARQRVAPVANLYGRALIKAAKEAAAYLGRPEPKARARRGLRTVSGGRTTELRRLVAEARRVAEQRRPAAIGGD